MKPISRLRTLARWLAERFSTGSSLRKCSPSDGVSSRPRIDSNVDLPQPDGPEMATYSPGRISRLMLERACVSTSSAKKTFLTLLRRIRL